MSNDCGILIHNLSLKIKKHLDCTVQSLGLTGVQSRIMHYVIIKYAEGKVLQRDVEKAFGMSRSTATGILQLMEKNGLIIRESAETDARMKTLTPTQKAMHLHDEIGLSIQRMERNLTRGLSDKKLSEFLKIASQMSSNLDT